MALVPYDILTIVILENRNTKEVVTIVTEVINLVKVVPGRFLALFKCIFLLHNFVA